MNLKLLSRSGYALLVIVLIALFYEGALLGNNIVAVVIQIALVLLMIWARATFGRRSFHVAANPTEGGLVTTGPYRFIRHPIYASILFFTWAGVLSHVSITSILCAIVASGGVAIRIYAEEKFLVKQYPEYVSYASRTKRIIPFII